MNSLAMRVGIELFCWNQGGGNFLKVEKLNPRPNLR